MLPPKFRDIQIQQSSQWWSLWEDYRGNKAPPTTGEAPLFHYSIKSTEMTLKD